MKILYELTTGLGDYYVLASDPTEAEVELLKIFNDQDYGFSKQRKVTNIKFISSEFKPAFNDKTKPFLSDESNLLIVDRWRKKIIITATQPETIYKINTFTQDYINHCGYKYWFEHRVAKDGDLCLATSNPYKYCNGFYRYSKKDPGSGKEYVVTHTTNKEYEKLDD